MVKANFEKIGYGQVEPNRMNLAEYGNGIVADIAVKVEDIKKVDNRIENGMVLAVEFGKGFKNNLKVGEVTLPTADSKILGLVVAENKLYTKFHSKKDFALFVEAPEIGNVSQMAYYDNVRYGNHDLHDTVVPRLFLFGAGDIFTTNLVAQTYDELEVGDSLFVNENGVIDKTGAIKRVTFTVVQKTTMPDGQLGVKLAVTEVKA